ncbi:MAG: hypothetical protein AAF412_07785, partial [Pseudomonadota bacterium]
KISCEFDFNAEHNFFRLRHPLRYKNEPMFNEVALPVSKADISYDSPPIHFSSDQELEVARADFYQATDEKLATMARAYSRPTYLEDILSLIDGFGNDPEFGHDASCHVCGADNYIACFDCGGVVCETTAWPTAWTPYPNVQEPKEVPCPYCGKDFLFFHPEYVFEDDTDHMDTSNSIRTRVLPRRKQQGGIEHQKMPAIAHERVEKKTGS